MCNWSHQAITSWLTVNMHGMAQRAESLWWLLQMIVQQTSCLTVGLKADHVQSQMPTDSWKPSLCSSQARASCFKAALIRLWCFVITRLVCSGMRNRPYVAVGLDALWWIEALKTVSAALHKVLTSVLTEYSQCSFLGYLIKSQQIISLNTSCGYSSTHTDSRNTAHADNHSFKWEYCIITVWSNKQIFLLVSFVCHTFNTIMVEKHLHHQVWQNKSNNMTVAFTMHILCHSAMIECTDQ